MADYLLSPPTRTDLQIDHDQFLAALRVEYPVAVITLSTGRLAKIEYAEWSLQMASGFFMGTIDQTGQVVALDGVLGDCATVAIWVRSIVPARYELLFYVPNLERQLPVSPETTVEDLIAAFT